MHSYGKLTKYRVQSIRAKERPDAELLAVSGLGKHMSQFLTLLSEDFYKVLHYLRTERWNYNLATSSPD